jgi:hypothetical protein
MPGHAATLQQNRARRKLETGTPGNVYDARPELLARIRPAER